MKETFGQRLARIRKKKGLTQEEVANKIVISPQAVSKWENDLSSPDILVLSSLADILGVTVDELLGRKPVEDGDVKADKAEENTAEEVVDDKEKHQEEDLNKSEGIHVVDDDGKEVHINNKGIFVKKDGKVTKVKCKAEDKPWIITTATLFGLALIGYILMGLLWTDKNMGWSMGWILFLLPIIVSSIPHAVRHRRICNFAYPILVVAAYCTLGFLGMYFGFEGWSFYWFLFLTIPAFYLIFGPIDKYMHRNDVKVRFEDDDDFDDDDDDEDDDEK